MDIFETRDKALLESYFRQDPAIHLYALGDLDEPFWEETRWIVGAEKGAPSAILLLLTKLDTPVVYGICRPGDEAMRSLIKAYANELPDTFVVHIGSGIVDALTNYHFVPEGTFFKMILDNPQLNTPLKDDVLIETDYAALKEFYSGRAYGEDNEKRFFEAFMLDMGSYRVIKNDGVIVSAAGVHLTSKQQGVAVLGNIATAPSSRAKGYASAVTARVCEDLLPHYRHIGLNVKADNVAGIRCYEKLGFRKRLQYVEGLMTRV